MISYSSGYKLTLHRGHCPHLGPKWCLCSYPNLLLIIWPPVCVLFDVAPLGVKLGTGVGIRVDLGFSSGIIPYVRAFAIFWVLFCLYITHLQASQGLKFRHCWHCVPFLPVFHIWSQQPFHIGCCYCSVKRKKNPMDLGRV